MHAARPLFTAGAAAILIWGSAGGASAGLVDPARQRERLENAREEADAAAERAERLERAAERERDAARKARAEEAAMAARIQETESEIAGARARIALADRLLNEQQRRLATRQEPVSRLMAALQSLSRRPTVLGLIQPGSTEDIVHVRAVLATVTPMVRERTRDIRGELARIRALRAGARDAVVDLRAGHARLEEQRLALTRMEAGHRLRSRDLDRSALFESDRAIALGERARDIVDLMESLDGQAERAEALAALPGPLPRPANPESADAPAPRDRAGPDTGPPPYRLPVAGRLLVGLGEVSDAGVRSRGLSIESAPGAQIVAPTDGRIVFAGPFRRYGTIIILDHGKGWSSAITGIGRLQVSVGDTVRQGAPIGTAERCDAPVTTVELRRRGVPVDLTGLLG